VGFSFVPGNCFAAGNCTLPGNIVGNLLRADDPILQPIPIESGYVPLRTALDLGVNLDEGAVRKYGSALL